MAAAGSWLRASSPACSPTVAGAVTSSPARAALPRSHGIPTSGRGSPIETGRSLERPAQLINGCDDLHSHEHRSQRRRLVSTAQAHLAHDWPLARTTREGAAAKCSNRADRDRPPCDSARTAHLHHRPAATPMPLDGKEKVYGSIPERGSRSSRFFELFFVG